ncbi:B-cell receptor CD22-like [Sardina pilchardus]|uniref:B-cell receptor CD22-like n=1 Tax=Sardina pilchardus TaxID=27697 RepID=UPI002E0D5BD3
MHGSVIMHVNSLVCMIFLSVIPGVWSQDLYSVTYPSKSVCALENSSVTLRCSYNDGPYGTKTGYWYKERILNGDPKDLRQTPEYKDRVWMPRSENGCGLNIRAIRDSDSGVYYYGFKAWEYRQTTTAWIHGSPGTNVTVLKEVQLEVDRTSVTQRIKITCATSCRLPATAYYLWYRNGKYLKYTEEPSTYIDSASDSGSKGSYRCVVQAGGYRLTSSDVCVSGPDCWGKAPNPSLLPKRRWLGRQLTALDAPRNVSVSLSLSGYIMEGRSMTLTCNSDANPPATYTWYRGEGGETFFMESGQQWNISNISSEFSGHYRCKAQNSIGHNDSKPFLLDVYYGPKNTSVLITPSGDIVEGDSVTLTCSSDANPPVHSYTWYKISRVNASLGSEQKHFMTNISSGDMGQYYCEVANTVGTSNSAVQLVNVFYSPKNTSVIVSSSGEGRSVTLTCTADANPPVHTYSWYRKTSSGSVLMDTGNSSSYTGVSDGDSYYCAVHNEYGSHNSSEIEVSFTDINPKSGLFVALRIIPFVPMIAVLVLVCRTCKGVYIIKNTSTVVDDRKGEDPSAVYEDVSAL